MTGEPDLAEARAAALEAAAAGDAHRAAARDGAPRYCLLQLYIMEISGVCYRSFEKRINEAGRTPKCQRHIACL